MRTHIGSSVGRNGKNHPKDVDTVLHLINVYRAKRGKDVLAPRKKCDDEMLQAIAEFQSSVLGDRVPTGLILPNSLDVAHLKCPLGTYRTPKSYSEPPWLAVAAQELGVRESAGLTANNPRILEYLSTVPGLSKLKHVAGGKATQHLMSDVDETAWCACFVKWCLTQAGIQQGLRDARARSWKTYGSQSGAKVGAITVIYRTPIVRHSATRAVGGTSASTLAARPMRQHCWVVTKTTAWALANTTTSRKSTIDGRNTYEGPDSLTYAATGRCVAPFGILRATSKQSGT